MRNAIGRTAVFLTAALGLAALAPASAQATSPDVLIGEIYGGGGNSGASHANDYVELYNRGAAAVALSGWSVQYASASGTTWAATPLSGSIPAGGRYLVKLASGGATGAALPTPDATGSTNMSATAGKVALVTTTSALTCGSNCDTAAGVRDFAGYGSANDFEGAAAAGGSNTTSIARGATDTDNNAADFTAGTPSPQNTAGGGGGGCAYPGTRIRAVQGKAHKSPLAGAAVSDVRGVVTARNTTGFWFQDPCPDADPATSEAVFVYTSSAPTVAAGDEVAVNATVTEYRPGGASTANLSTTELTAPSVTKLGTKPVPAATVIGSGGRVPPTAVIDNDANGDVETAGTFDAATDGIDFYESLEGMRVQVNNPVAAGPTSGHAEIPVLADNGAGAGVRTTRGGIMVKAGDFNPERVILDDALLAGSTPAVNVGDHFSGPAVGVLDYDFGGFRLELTSALTRVAGTLAPETTTAAGAGEVSVATFNVENLDPADPQAKFDGLARQIVTNLAAPGILAVEEIQDNDGPANSSTVDAAQTFGKLIAAITAAGGPSYDYRQVNPVDDADGGEPGGNIRVGFLFRTDKVSFAPGSPGGPTTAVSASASGNSADPIALSANPGRIQPANTAFNASRKPLVGKFLVGGKPLYVIANHFNSKGGDDPLFGRRQPPVLSSETQRNQQAAIVADFVTKLRAIDSAARIVVAGDLNDFEFSAPVSKLTAVGLTDLPGTLPDAERYTYVYEGNSQVLDHILVSPALVSAGYAYDVVHVNAEFAAQLSDHDPQVVRLKI
ncbi:endonuclease [Actinorhabdospora filicis]|uniref:Endonuclease n=1 Tax=Actinorhabdospora filicis TaxID=1785913 RepID=A0A9W6SQM3_9ACTN|nr:lamin tail domain-containing protein [Actinorhabdospora filicis]GLZ80214.1 endonuclease [Actinorhabdospora filicis]